MGILHQQIVKRLASAAVVSVVFGLSACSAEPERGYAVPEDLCGVRAERSLIEPFLPEGENLRQNEENYGAGDRLYSCSLRVDGSAPLILYGAWRHADFRVRDAVAERIQNVPHADIMGDAAVWDTGAAIVFPCSGGPNDSETYSVIAQTPPPDDPEAHRKALRELVGAYADEYKKTLPCGKS